MYLKMSVSFVFPNYRLLYKVLKIVIRISNLFCCCCHFQSAAICSVIMLWKFITLKKQQQQHINENSNEIIEWSGQPTFDRNILELFILKKT
jgi:hypothetical protein